MDEREAVQETTRYIHININGETTMQGRQRERESEVGVGRVQVWKVRVGRVSVES